MTENINKELETGRSMVEMLGTLAIIGVLSVGSIAGYRYAMDNYYTNEILAGASQRAVLVAAQITAGQTPSLAEFRKIETAGGEFDGTIKEWDGEFGIQVTKVKESVCKNLIKATEDTDIIITDTDGVDLAEGDCSGDNNTFLFVYSNDLGKGGEDADPACANVTCDDGLTCFHGECKCSNGLFVCGTQCCAEGTYCVKGADTSTYTCAVPTGECTKNSDCKDAEGNVDTTKYCEFTSGSCTNPGTGTCTDKGTLTPYTLNLPGGALTVYVRSSIMTWWSASNLCQAHGKQMVTMSDLGISGTAGKNYCYFDSAWRVNDAMDETYQCNCTGDNGCTTTTTELYDKFGTSGSLWLADNSKSSSCNARHVTLDIGSVYYGYRRIDYSALCR